MRMQEMYDARASILKEQRDLLESYGEKPLSAEDAEKYGKMEQRFEQLTESIERAKKVEEREREARVLASDTSGDLRAGASASKTTQKAPYVRAFEDYLRTGIAAAELRATTDPQTIGTAGDGGYAVPDEWYNTIVELRHDVSIMRQLATIITSNSGTMNVAAESVEGAASVYGENSQIAVAKETITRVQFSPYKIGRIIKESAELANDSTMDFTGYLLRKLARSIAVKEEALCVSGTGSSQHNGIFTAATTGVTAASATAITADEVIDLYHSVGNYYRRDASWIMKDATLKLVRKLKDGQGQYLWQPGLQAAQPDLILGRPVYISPDAPAATAGLDAILFGWVGGYYIVERKGFELQVLTELYADYDMIGYKGTARSDGDLVDTSAVRVLTML